MILQGFFAQLPKGLLESAVVDGCSYTRFFWQITLPLSRPVLATVGVLALVGSWNAFLLPLVMINSESLYPWPLGICTAGPIWNRLGQGPRVHQPDTRPSDPLLSGRTKTYHCRPPPLAAVKG